MIRLAALALLGALTITTASRMHGPAEVQSAAVAVMPTAIDDPSGSETLEVYYSPLDSTRVARFFGLGMAYHMAIVYTDRNGVSRAASSGPTDLSAPQTPEHALSAVFASFDDQPSTFGTLASDPRNGTPFRKGGAGDHSTQDDAGHAFPRATVLHGNNLSARWGSILRTYARIDAMKLTYSPVTQNSNSLATTALRRAGVALAFSSNTVFVPGAFTDLP